MTQTLKIGVIGTGLIAQVMHLNFLRDLSDRYQIAALCDLAVESAECTAKAYNVDQVFSDWRDILRQPIDAVLILTSGNHASIVVEAARAGKHVFVEKPLSFSVVEGKAVREAAVGSGVVVMVGYPKRYDEAFLRFRQEAVALKDPVFWRVTTFESPFRPYVSHYELPPGTPLPEAAVERLKEENERSISWAIGEALDSSRTAYRDVLLDTLVHELNTVRAVLGEPSSVDYVDISRSSVTVMLRFRELPVAIHWLDLPGIARYRMEFAAYSAEKRVTVHYPSPYLRSAPTLLEIEGGDLDSVRSWKTEEISSYDSPFKRELAKFHDCVMTGQQAPTGADDALRDIALCQSIVQCHRTGTAVADPSRLN